MFSGLMANTWIAGTIVAVVAGAVGFFAVLRGSTFAAHAVPNGAFAGGAGAALLGVNSIAGLGVFAVGGALGIAALGRRGRRDVATALGLVTMLGLGAAFLSVTNEYAAEAYALLFGEVFGVATGQLLPLAVLAAACVAVIAACYRPLLLSSTLPEAAAARGVRPARMEVVFLLVLALAATLTVPVVGALLMFGLMIGPAAAARSVTSRPLLALTLSAVGAMLVVWTGIACSYLLNWPLGFFVGTLGAALYLAGRGHAAWRRRRVARHTP